MDNRIILHHGDMRDILATLDPKSIDAVVCDPPYEISFMSAKWDGKRVSFDPATWEACYRVLKPGGYLLAFGGDRTIHRIMVAIENAGFEIRTQLVWLHGQGFPKSADVSKAIDKAAGATREVVGSKITGNAKQRTKASGEFGSWAGTETSGQQFVDITAPATPEAEQWQGWHTALKPAMELICMARKPLAEKTVAANVLKHGTGAINVDACRIGESKQVPGSLSGPSDRIFGKYGPKQPDHSGQNPNIGRWPSNVVLDEAAAELLDEMSGDRPVSGSAKNGRPATGDCYNETQTVYGGGFGNIQGRLHNDTGGASRYFKVVAQDDEPITRFLYTSKASRAERNAGLDGMPERVYGLHDDDSYRSPGERKANHTAPLPASNFHPCVKPLSLMRWLVRMVTPPDGTVLDPFAGSGTTGVAAILEGFGFVGIEQELEYVEIARARIAHAQRRGRQLALEGEGSS
ncbi:MAG: DNA-methyltransferase [Gemmatimonadaceae bacterium]